MNTNRLFHSKLALADLPEVIQKNGGFEKALNKQKSGHIPLSSAIMYGAKLDVIKYLFEKNKKASIKWRSPTGSKSSSFFNLIT